VSLLQKHHLLATAIRKRAASPSWDNSPLAWPSRLPHSRTRERLRCTLIIEIVVDGDEKAGEIILVIHRKASTPTYSCTSRNEDRCREEGHGCHAQHGRTLVDEKIATSLNRMGECTPDKILAATHPFHNRSLSIAKFNQQTCPK
jgi:hypothetical protein